MRKRPLRKRLWATVDRYDHRWPPLEELYRTKAEAIEAAALEIERGYTLNGRLSVVRVTVEIESEVEVTR